MVEVLFNAVKFWRVDEEVTRSVERFPVVPKRLVNVPLVAKKLVEVALVEVEFVAVNAWRVVEPVWSTFATVRRPVNELLPEKVLLSARSVEDAVPEIAPQVTLPFTTLRALEPAQLPVAMKRFVVEAVVLKKFVVVAEVPVALMKVKFWRVVEEVTRRFNAVARPAADTEN